jgi:signal transduction histidine kinase
MVSELRLSIFDLRRNSGAGIAQALADTTRQLGADGDLTVHLVLDEDPARLATGSGPQILRIAQEAITNAQRHAAARTLWVTYRVSDSGVYLRVADDGQGVDVTRARSDSYGITIMRERAARINGDLTITPRDGGGTVVTLTVQPATANPPADIMGTS